MGLARLQLVFVTGLVDKDGLGVAVAANPGLPIHLAHAAVFEAAEGRRRVADQPPVQPDHAVVQPFADLQGAPEIAGKDIKYEKKLYQATLPTLLQTLENSPWQKGTIMLLGHNPEMESLLNYLCDGNIKPSKTGKLFPTGSIAVIHLAGEITESSGNLIDIARPKEL